MPDREELPWAAMLKLAGVRVEEVASATGHSLRYVYQQLRGDRPMQYDVRAACTRLLSERKQRWVPVVRSIVRVLAEKHQRNNCAG